MNRMRVGAVLVSADGRIGFYLSRRVVLTVPTSGVVRAVSFEEFGKCRVFARSGVAVSCFEAMMHAAETDAKFGNSLEMVNFFLDLPERFAPAAPVFQRRRGNQTFRRIAEKVVGETEAVMQIEDHFPPQDLLASFAHDRIPFRFCQIYPRRHAK